MYGTNGTQAGALAATGSAALGAAGVILSIGVLILAGITLVTIVAVLRHRMKEDNDDR